MDEYMRIFQRAEGFGGNDKRKAIRMSGAQI